MNRSDAIDSATTEDGLEPVHKSDMKVHEPKITDSPSTAETIDKGEIATGEEVSKTDDSTDSSDGSAKDDDSKSCGKQLVKEDGSLNWDIKKSSGIVIAAKFKFNMINVTKSVHNNILAGSLKTGSTHTTVIALY